MAGIFDYIPIITIVLFALGLVGIMVYERSRSKSTDESDS
jgi:NADH:ubiquinone oxidoreductase subunit K